jgi:hypothetical protein
MGKMSSGSNASKTGISGMYLGAADRHLIGLSEEDLV